MASKGSYIIVGENIHCTRIRLAGGKFVAAMPDGRSALAFKEGKETRLLPIPDSDLAGEEWKNGRVKHVAVAIRQGMYGAHGDREAGKSYLRAMALEQEAAGAWFLDVNVDEFSLDVAEKVEAIRWAAEVIQGASSLPLSIDSSDASILEAGLAACDMSKGKPLVNSISLERAAMIPIAAKAGARVIAGATGALRMPEGVEERLVNIRLLMKRLGEEGFAADDVFLDPLVMPVAVNTSNPGLVIETIRALRKEQGPEVHFAPGLSNVSYGLPKRALINQVFAWLCWKAGCDGGIVDPAQVNDAVLAGLDAERGAAKLAMELLLGRDEYGMGWIAACRDGKA
jgi:cobalamin-dependent methionine synthase I